MSRNDDVVQAIGTGWTLFDWTPGNRIPWVRIAGCMPATRIQLDRYRQNLQMVGKEGQIQLWCWSTSTFTVTHRYNNAGVQTEVRTPQAYPESATVETAITPREYRITGGAIWGTGSYQTSRSTTTTQMTIASRFFGQFSFAWFAGYQSRLVMSGSSGVKVRILVIGQHNRSWNGILP